MLRRLGHLSLIFGLSTCLASHVLADEDRLTWGKAPGDMFGYALVEDDPPPSSLYAKGRWAHGFTDTAWLAIPIQMEKGKHPSREVRTACELFWALALDLPESAKEGSSAVQKTFRIQSLPVLVPHVDVEVEVSGKEDLKRSSGTIQLTSTLTLDQKKVLPFAFLSQGSTLILERTFDESAHALSAVKFDITMALAGPGGRSTEHRTGKLALRGKFDAGSKELLEAVDGAVKRGVKALVPLLKTELASRIKQRKDLAKLPNTHRDGGLGEVALATFALLRSGVPPADLEDAFDFMAHSELRQVYGVSLYIMCLEARSVKRADAVPEAGGRTVSQYTREALPDSVKKEMSRAVAWLVGARSHGAWSYEVMPLALAQFGGDRSNTQFATLALHCAVQSGCSVDAAVFRDIVDEVGQAQEPDGPAQSMKVVGWTPLSSLAQPEKSDAATKAKAKETPARARGWAYGMRQPCAAGKGYGSMTGAGLSSAAIAREGLRSASKLDAKMEAATRREIEDGVAWFVQNWSPETDANQPTNNFGNYYLYSVEKAMEIAGVETLGGRDWWREGCALLLASESKEAPGTWLGVGVGLTPLNETAFALLFLNRATLPAARVTTLTGADEKKKD